jgi:hypothetical protein
MLSMALVGKITDKEDSGYIWAFDIGQERFCP